MGILKSAADLVYTIRFLKLLVTPFEKTDAYKSGIIDKDGKKNKDFSFDKVEDRENYRSHYTPFHRLVYNLKRLMAKVPGGQSVVARYGAALMLIKEHGELNDYQIEMIHEKTGIDILDCLAEESQWFMQENEELAEGMYRIKYDTMTTSCEDIVKKGDQIRVINGAHVDEVLGLKIYEGTHVKTKHRVLFSTAEITK